ncbi:ankyrin repeat domain-containing protein [Paenibacillus radicis (ex Xue et al. 2023)]|uniref:Ankyrin repeat domain-containing protein n=1 Tax=Paenibacillus radicis (ex Xue et al. 2023) TaxID=2972489 RepID=A0ABT1YFN9_9BACL|nr:ankyrin repeat domain-containing protein [Paenibacillus radicis (ex Xue et al. 2023)]MCR8632019.1 ankyrin repeat domain-containing protein [Paenibacillus radicis (ex Xue et al. 2023)]
MKKLVIGMILGAGLTLSTVVYASDTIQAIKFQVSFLFNGVSKQVDSEYTVLNYNGHAYVPIRFVAESMRGQVEYDETKQQISIKYGTPTEQKQTRVEMTALQLFDVAGHGDLIETKKYVDAIAPEDLNPIFLQILKIAHMFQGKPHVADLVDLLIGKKVDLNMVDESNGYTPLHYAAERAIDLTGNLLDAKANVNVSANGMTPLMQVASKKKLGLVNKMLAMGADPNLGGGALLSALHPFAHSGLTDESVEIVKSLLANKADVHTAGFEGETPLLAAVDMSMPQNLQIVRILIEHGADPNQKPKSNWNGTTPLMRAVNPFGYDTLQGVYEMTELLIDAKADVNAVDEKGNTSLSYAVEFNQHALASNEEVTKVIQLLLRKGANKEMKDNNGLTPLDKAKEIVDEKKRSEILKLLEK